MNIPLETSIIRHKLVKIGHELVNSLPHVHVPHIRPYSVRVREYRRLIFVRADGGLELVPAQWPKL
jgi:hypothetical protein